MARSRKTIAWCDMREIPYRAARLFRSLSNPKAYQLVQELMENGETEFGDLVTLLDRSRSRVSQILKALRDLNVVRYQKVESETWYRLKHPREIRRVLESAETFVVRSEQDLETAT